MRDEITRAKTLVFVGFRHVTAEEMNQVRTACVHEEVRFLVAKKTLMQKAFADADIAGEFPNLEGEVALVSGEDLLAAARVAGEQGKALEDRLRIIGGVFEGAFVSEEKMQAIADIPPIKTLYAQFLMIIKSPVQQFTSVIDQVAQK